MNELDNHAVPIVVERQFSQPIEQVWAAITVRDRMVRWFFDNIPDFKAEVGFETSFDVDSGNRVFRHLWKITEVVIPSKIVYHWSYPDFDCAGTVTFQLDDNQNGTLVRITNEGLHTFPDDIPEFTRESCLGGWEYFIGNLKEYLDGN